MPLDDLVQVIETLQQRIREHGDSLRPYETRTRVALIDPLLTALGWNVSDPSLVIPEYDVRGRRADYALLSAPNQPAATIEAKKLGEPLDSHQIQMLNYSNAAGINYAGLTDGNLWELYDVFERGDLDKRRILEVNLSSDPVFQSALKLLLLWRPNLASGQPVEAEKPILTDPREELEEKKQEPPPPPDNGNWEPLSQISPVARQQAPRVILLPSGEEKPVTSWAGVSVEVAEWLIVAGKLTTEACPIGHPITSKQIRYIVNSEPIHSNGKAFASRRQLSNGLFMETNFNSAGSIANARFLLQHFNVGVEAVRLR